MQVIDQINGSALFAQSAFSAGMASKDNLGRNITATYLTGINIPGSANWEEATTAYQTNSASYITSLSSPLGTIEISGNQIESTNSGIERITYPPIQPESISSNRSNIAPSSDAIFTKTLISTTVMAPNAELWLKVEGGYFYEGEKILYSGSNGSSGEFDLRTHMKYGLGFITASIPNEQLLYVYDSRQWIGFSPEQSFVSGDEMEQVKCERLAWASEVGGGFPVSADEAVQYVQTNSAGIDDTITNVTTNSGAWGGSAIPVSAGEGVKVDYTNGMLVFKQDRTLLYSGTTQVTGFTASEPLTNFERVEFIVSPDPNLEGPSIITYPMINANTARMNLGWVGNFNAWRNISWNYLFNTNDNIVFTAISGSYFGLQDNGTTGAGTWNAGALWLLEVNGINRKV